MDPNDAYNVLTGHPLIVTVGEHHLADDPELWREVWEKYGGELLAEEIRLYPGRRPRAWHVFDCAEEPADDESEVEFLYRIGELSAGELEAIRLKALELVTHNGCGRRPEKPSSNFIAPRALERFAARIGLLTADERAVLRLDERGRYQYADRHPRWET